MALAVAQVGGNVTTASGGAGITGTFGSSTTTGSLIVVIGHAYHTSGASADGNVTDNKGNSYTLVTALLGGVNAPGIGIWYNNGGTRGSSHSCTYNAPGAADSTNISMIEITGHDATTPLDSTTFATASDGTSPFAVTAAAAISGNQIAIYGCTLDSASGNNAWGDPSGYTPIISQGDSAKLTTYAGYKINETGTPSPAATNADSVAAGGAREVIATFKEGATAATGGSLDRPEHPGNPFDPSWQWQQRYGVDASQAVNVSAGSASITFTANQPTASVAPTGGNAAVTFTSNQAGKAIAPNAGAAAVTFAANQPTASLGAQGGNAAITFTANNAGKAVNPNAGAGAVTFTANQPTAGVSPSAGNAAVTFTANQGTASLGVNAGVATFVFTANQPTINAGSNVSVNAGVASFTFTANNASLSIKPNANEATITFTGNQPAVSLGVPAGAGAVSFTGNNATGGVSAAPSTAALTFTANAASLSIEPNATVATFTFTANNAFAFSGEIIQTLADLVRFKHPIIVTYSEPAAIQYREDPTREADR